MDFLDSVSNRKIFDFNKVRKETFFINPQKIYPWWWPCNIKTLIVTDGGLDFAGGDFGLSTFVHILQNDRPSYVRFNLTLAHLRSDVTPDMVMEGAPGIERSIIGFRFDEDDHFTPDRYDQIWMFGIETFFHSASYVKRNEDPNRYPNDRLGDQELRQISAHMNGGGGVFATGDHGALGRALCGSVNRIRGMRHWSSFPSTDPAVDQVSMMGPLRNDTNQIGHDPGSQFSDQSDDVPQPLDLRLYSSRLGFFQNARYPHPVLCGRMGRIDVLPDHPHEGECRGSDEIDLTLNYDFDGTPEYPMATGGSGQIPPEVIAWSHVPAGNNARGTKTPTMAHTFGAISAYDGHRAGVGRVICDATWHHFVNVNLVGVVEGGGFDEFRFPGEDPSKHDGFLDSPQGLIALNKIKNYYTNIGVWIARPASHVCFRSHFWRVLAYKDRIMEAALVDPNIAFDRIPADVFLHIGIHARDVLNRTASQCQTTEWVLDWTKMVWAEIPPLIDPWDPLVPPQEGERVLPVFDPTPLIDMALGGALVTMRQAFPYPPEAMDNEFDERARSAAIEGARRALDIGMRNAQLGMRQFNGLLTGRGLGDAPGKRGPDENGGEAPAEPPSESPPG